METDYERRLREMIEQVQAQESIRTERYEPGPIATYMERPEDALKIARIVGDGPLPTGLTSNFHRHSMLSFAWRSLEPFEAIAGEIHLIHIAEALVRRPREEQVAKTDSEAGRLVAELKIFETHPVGGTGTYSALRLTASQNSPEVWYFDLRQGPTRLHISYGDYLDATLRTKGLYDWQYLYAEPDPSNYGMRVSVPYLRDGLGLLAQKFPDDDLSDLRTRLEERAAAVDEEL
ncbi:hypothetical protein AB0G97_03660 [Streptomyces sp. NPDC020755]|uniref:hypothetical protein n=1 Tax=Streptomyces sp. NPDC020755 TaxID=3154790 RepID=UPI0033EB65D1